MILIGSYVSPFVRRSAIIMHTLGIEFEHKILKGGPDNDELVAINPLARVPALVLDDNEVIIDSSAIVDHILEIDGRANNLLPEREIDRV